MPIIRKDGPYGCGGERMSGPSRTRVPMGVWEKAKEKIQFPRIGFCIGYSSFCFSQKKVPALPWGPVITCGSRRWVASPLLLCFQRPIKLYDLTGRPAIDSGSPASRIRNVGPNGPDSTNRAGIKIFFGNWWNYCFCATVL